MSEEIYLSDDVLKRIQGAAPMPYIPRKNIRIEFEGDKTMYGECAECVHNQPIDYNKFCQFCFANGRKFFLPKHLTDQERRYTYKAALEEYGLIAQDMMAIEEMSELTKEICKVFRGKGNLEALADEIADVTIMLEQLQLFYDLEQTVQEHVDMKVRRLQKRLGMEVSE